MKLKSLCLTLALGFMAGLFACQDGGVVAPDDVISPDNLVATFGKPDKTCPDGGTWPKCEDDDGGDTGGNTASLTITGGMTGGMDGAGEGLEVAADNGNILSIRAPKDLVAQLAASVFGFVDTGDLETGQYGSCRAKPAYTPRATVNALMAQLNNPERDEPVTEPIMDGSKVEIKKKYIGEPSDGHFIALNYDTPNPLLNRIFLRVGAGALFDDYPSVYDGPLTTVTYLGDDTYKFSGGTVWVGAQIGPVQDRPFLECPLLDEVWVLIER